MSSSHGLSSAQGCKTFAATIVGPLLLSLSFFDLLSEMFHIYWLFFTSGRNWNSSVLKLLKLYLSMTNFKFRNKHYALSDGLPIGSPASLASDRQHLHESIRRKSVVNVRAETESLVPICRWRFLHHKKDTRSETTLTPQQPTSLNSFHRGVRERREIAVLRGQHQPHGRQTRPLKYIMHLYPFANHQISDLGLSQVWYF